MPAMAQPPQPNIGITFFATHRPGVSVWSNGCLQNILALFFLLRDAPDTGQVWLINEGDAESLPPTLQLAEPDLPLVRFREVADRLDVLIEGGAQVKPEQAEQVHRRHGAVIAYRCGNDYIMDSERICFNLQPGSAFNGTCFDEIWTHPQHEHMCRHFWQLALRAPVRIMPFIWTPRFLDYAIDRLQLSQPEAHYGYRPDSGASRIAVFEPNLNVIKTFITPMLICEAAYRQSPEAISQVYITNTSGLTEHPSFVGLTHAMDLHRQRIMSYEARYSLPMFLSTYANTVVSHQWENGLNYLYFDVLYGHYPLIHNSPWLRDYGYYYPDFDAEVGAQQLLHAIASHDDRLDEYQSKNQTLFRQVAICAQSNIDLHLARIFTLLAQNAARD